MNVNINKEIEGEFQVLGGEKYTFLPYQKTFPVIGGISDSSIYKKVITQENSNTASKKVFYHQTSKAEELKDIASIHQVSIDDIVTLNKLSHRSIINPNIKLKIRKNQSSKFLKYGSLIINWADWRYLDGNYINQAKNKKY